MEWPNGKDDAKFHKLEDPSGEHFSQAWHSFHQIQGLAVKQVWIRDSFILKAREALLREALKKENI